ncbi:TonB-dependent siderophore receptor [Cellvibrio sp. pealriver]|uniref:TonB-dependent siderophore receptor n=1 Tax=Cellvibrio sp. pealriver TaxID=1622269 RepID=UPI00066FD344|nr:TonB-dependent siderophore receptor [Cellvibrio sp. pealriver]
MRHLSRSALALSVASIIWGASAYAQTSQTPDASKGEIETTYVYGEPEKTKTATKLNLSVLETPQVVSVISRDQIDDFSLREINSLLTYVPGVTVEQVETGRTYYTARGFDIVNFQYDGLGVPFAYGLGHGHDDTAIYEQVEVVKGATGLITGLANPSATINYVRKRPTQETQASITGSGGSWNQYRVDGDISGPIVADTLSGRLVVAKQDGDSYLDRYGKELTVFYGVVSGEVTDTTRFTLGHSINDSHSDANSSGALPLFYSDGSLTHYDASTNTAPAWAYQDVEQTRSFVELEQDLGANWVAKAVYTRNGLESEWTSLYLAGAPDPVTEEGLLAHASLYQADDQEDIFDLFVSGSFSLFGQEHELVAGINTADITLTGRSIYTDEWNYAPVGANWADGKTALPVFDVYDAATQSTDIDQKQDSYYVSTRLNLTDALSLLLGSRTVDIEQDGINYGAPATAADDETVPYAGITYEALPGTVLYASYSEVFNAQTWVDADLLPLGAVRGESTEAGVKQEVFDGNAVLTLAMFESRQENFGEWVTRDEASGLNIYRGVEFESDGFEVELAGEIFTGLNISAGYTQVGVEDENGNDTRRFIPKHQFKVATAYAVPAVSGLRLGAGINWQSELYVGNTRVQGDFALVDLFAQYALTPNLSLALNINNATDEKYLLSPQWGQANYGAPLNAMGSITWRY